MLYGLAPGGRAGAAGGAEASSESVSVSSSSVVPRLTAGSGAGLMRATAAGGLCAEGVASPIAAAGALIETGEEAGSDATAGEAPAAGDIADTGGGFAGGFGIG